MTLFDEIIVTLHDDQYRVSPMRMVGLTSFTVSNKLRPSSPGKGWILMRIKMMTLVKSRAHICHKYHKLYLWRKNCHVEKFWEILPQFTRFHVEKNLAQKVHLWRKNDKSEV